MSLEYIDAEILKQMIIAGANLLEKNKQYVDELNVFPVPDGDTGTNMSLTVMAAAKEVQKVQTGNVSDIAKALSSGSLRGARGNSGVILSQLFRGFYKGLKDAEQIDAIVLANAFQEGVDTAYKAVMKPKEGTILTVARAGTEKAVELSLESNDMEYILKETINHAQKVLEKTPEMLPVLKEAGVVDAGGQGLIFILKGASLVLKGTGDIKLSEQFEQPSTKFSYTPSTTVKTKDIKFGYCTEFIINVDEQVESINDLREYFGSIGDSVVVVSDEEIIKVHVHTNEPGNAIQKAFEYGYLTNIKIDNMRVQHASNLNIDAQIDHKVELKETGFIAVSIGDGLKKIFKGLGVDYIIEGGQTMNPSTEDILNAVNEVNAKNVFILPNNKNIILAAEQAKHLCEDKMIIVIPTKNIPQGISALINYDVDNSIDENIESMKENLELVKTGQITYAVRDTNVDAKEIKKDDILGIEDNKILVVGEQIEQTAKDLINQLVDEDSELITIYYGEDVTEDNVSSITDYIEENYPECEVEVHYGGQPLYYYIFSVE